MLYGIDISNWQNGINLSKLTNDIDFVICKATEGLNYEDPCFEEFMFQAVDVGLLRGFYHFARENNPIDEAKDFYNATKQYIGYAIPVLDYETENEDNCSWCEEFMYAYHELSGVWPMLYISASRVPQYDNSWIPEKCGLWLAGYPYPATKYDVEQEMPYGIGAWEFCAIWQFTSNLSLWGYAGRLDGDYAYMDSSAWLKYCKSDKSDNDSGYEDDTEPLQPILSYTELCKSIMRGEWGNGEDRRERLTRAGYDYVTAQDMIDDYFELANDIWLGKWGNGWNRQTALEGAGYDYELAQMCVDAVASDWIHEYE